MAISLKAAGLAENHIRSILWKLASYITLAEHPGLVAYDCVACSLGRAPVKYQRILAHVDELKRRRCSSKHLRNLGEWDPSAIVTANAYDHTEEAAEFTAELSFVWYLLLLTGLRRLLEPI